MLPHTSHRGRRHAAAAFATIVAAAAVVIQACSDSPSTVPARRFSVADGSPHKSTSCGVSYGMSICVYENDQPDPWTPPPTPPPQTNPGYCATNPWACGGGSGSGSGMPGGDAGPNEGDCASEDLVLGALPSADDYLVAELNELEAAPIGGPFVPEAPLPCPFVGQGACRRDATAAEGAAILAWAENEPDWTYTQGGARGGSEPSRNVSERRGDCTDFTWQATRSSLPNTWGQAHGWNEKLSTTMFEGMSENMLEQRGYRRVSMDQARPGDVVVRSGHAGIYKSTDASGNIWGIANNGLPATPSRPNVDRPTGAVMFNPSTMQPTTFYRPLIPTC